MRLHGRGIEEHLRGWATGLGQGLEQIGPDALGRPAHEPIVERLLRTIDLAWRIRPTPARLQHMDDAADHPTVIDALLAPRLGRTMRSSQTVRPSAKTRSSDPPFRRRNHRPSSKAKFMGPEPSAVPLPDTKRTRSSHPLSRNASFHFRVNQEGRNLQIADAPKDGPAEVRDPFEARTGPLLPQSTNIAPQGRQSQYKSEKPCPAISRFYERPGRQTSRARTGCARRTFVGGRR